MERFSRAMRMSSSSSSLSLLLEGWVSVGWPVVAEAERDKFRCWRGFCEFGGLDEDEERNQVEGCGSGVSSLGWRASWTIFRKPM